MAKRERGDSIKDALLALRALVSQRWTMAELADELGQNVRTTYRLLQGVEAAGIQVHHQREGQRVYHQVERRALESALGLR